MASSESRKRKLEEYEMQLFGFHSRAVFATLKAIVYEKIHSVIKKLYETLEKTYKPDPENLVTLKESRKRLERAYRKGAITHLKKIENIINISVSIPPNVLLDEDKHQRIQYTDEEFANIKQRLEDLQQRAERATMFNAVLKEELQTLEQCEVYDENATRMCNIIVNAARCRNTSNEMFEVVENYRTLNRTVCGTRKTSDKTKYNNIDNLKCYEINFDDL